MCSVADIYSVICQMCTVLLVAHIHPAWEEGIFISGIYLAIKFEVGIVFGCVRHMYAKMLALYVQLE